MAATNAINEGTTGICGFTGTAFTGTAATNHAVIVGGSTSSTLTNVGPTSTAGQVLQSAGASADPAFSTATYPATTTVSQLLYSSATNTVAGLATANRAVVTTNSTGVPVVTALATDGQLIIGSTAGAPAAASLTAGANITITPGSNSISIAATSGGPLTWTSVTTTPFTFSVNNNYIINVSPATLTLPTTFAIGDVINIMYNGTGSAVAKITAGTGTFIRNIQTTGASSTSGGTAQPNGTYGAGQFTGVVANTSWAMTAGGAAFTAA